VSTIREGSWPDTWPEELDVYRAQAKTVDVAHGIQETHYEIRFKNREDFERAWPHLLAVKSPGSPLIIENNPSTNARSGQTAGTGVRVLAPVGGQLGTWKVNGVLVSPPSYDPGELGEPPEYVAERDGKWVSAVPGTQTTGFYYRARIDLVLIADGDIVDLNRIALPKDTPIVDRRNLVNEAH
jgi:hypothetical protein